MKTILTLLVLPVIAIICLYSGKFYIAGNYVAAYSLVLTSFLSLTFWIRQIGLVTAKQHA